MGRLKDKIWRFQAEMISKRLPVGKLVRASFQSSVHFGFGGFFTIGQLHSARKAGSKVT